MITASLSLFISGAGHFNRLWIFLSFSFSTLTAALAVREYSRLKTARLIIENQILYIQPVEMGHSGWFVSCFGILIDSRIIKFNQAGIRLLTVEIGQDYLSIGYGTNMDLRNIRMHYDRPDSATLAGILEKFRYETGIVPVVVQ